MKPSPGQQHFLAEPRCRKRRSSSSPVHGGSTRPAIGPKLAGLHPDMAPRHGTACTTCTWLAAAAEAFWALYAGQVNNADLSRPTIWYIVEKARPCSSASDLGNCGDQLLYLCLRVVHMRRDPDDLLSSGAGVRAAQWLQHANRGRCLLQPGLQHVLTLDTPGILLLAQGHAQRKCRLKSHMCIRRPACRQVHVCHEVKHARTRTQAGTTAHMLLRS